MTAEQREEKARQAELKRHKEVTHGLVDGSSSSSSSSGSTLPTRSVQCSQDLRLMEKSLPVIFHVWIFDGQVS